VGKGQFAFDGGRIAGGRVDRSRAVADLAAGIGQIRGGRKARKAAGVAVARGMAGETARQFVLGQALGHEAHVLRGLGLFGILPVGGILRFVAARADLAADVAGRFAPARRRGQKDQAGTGQNINREVTTPSHGVLLGGGQAPSGGPPQATGFFAPPAACERHGVSRGANKLVCLKSKIYTGAWIAAGSAQIR